MSVEMPESALAVMLPDAESALSRIRDGGLGQEDVVSPAHITLLFPWMPPSRIDAAVLQELRVTFGGFPPIDVTLELGWFGREVLLLVPDDPEPLVAMTSAVIARWPEFPYCGGDYDEIEPHLTLAYGDEGSLAPMADAVSELLPLRVRADAVSLVLGPAMSVKQEFSLGNLPSGVMQ